MIEGITKSGFKYKLTDDARDDYELVELLSDYSEDPTVFPKIARRLLGPEQHKALKEHVRNKNGIVTNTAMEAEITDIFNAGAIGEDQLKN